MKKRLFISIPLSEYLRKIFVGYQAEQKIGGVKWTAPENLHVTLYFLGDIEEEIASIVEKISNVIAGIRPFKLEFEKISLAPPGRPPYMIWAVFSDEEGAYKRLVDTLHSSLGEFVTRDNRNKESIPHITLARFRDPSIVAGITLTQPVVEDRILEISSCDLMESKLSSEGPSYSIIESFSLSLDTRQLSA